MSKKKTHTTSGGGGDDGTRIRGVYEHYTIRRDEKKAREREGDRACLFSTYVYVRARVIVRSASTKVYIRAIIRGATSHRRRRRSE